MLADEWYYLFISCYLSSWILFIARPPPQLLNTIGPKCQNRISTVFIDKSGNLYINVSVKQPYGRHTNVTDARKVGAHLVSCICAVWNGNQPTLNRIYNLSQLPRFFFHRYSIHMPWLLNTIIEEELNRHYNRPCKWKLWITIALSNPWKSELSFYGWKYNRVEKKKDENCRKRNSFDNLRAWQSASLGSLFPLWERLN